MDEVKKITSLHTEPFESSDGDVSMEVFQLRRYLLAKSNAENFLLLVIRSLQKGAELSRLTVNLGIIIDRSHSMLGPPFLQAAEGAIALMRNLTQRDRMSILLFDEDVETVIEGEGPEKMPEVANVLRNALVAGGNTDMSKAIKKGAATLSKLQRSRDVSKLIIITDGNPNRGITDDNSLIKLVEDIRSEGISLSAVGLGPDYNEDLLVKLTDAGGGYYYHSSRPRDIKKLFQRELGIVKNIHLRGLELSLKTVKDFRVREIYQYDSRTISGEHIITLPDLERAQELEILLNVNASPHGPGIFKAMDLNLSYRAEGTTERNSVIANAVQEFTYDPSKLKESTEKRVDKALTMKNVQSHLLGTIQGIKTRTLSREEAFKQLKDYQKTLVMSGRTIEAMEIQEAIHSYGRGEDEDATKKLTQSAQWLKRPGRAKDSNNDDKDDDK